MAKINGNDLKRRRETLQLTQGQLAEKLGVALNTVSRWENEASFPESYKMLDLALRQLEFEQLLTQNEQVTQSLVRLQQSRSELESLLVTQTITPKTRSKRQ